MSDETEDPELRALFIEEVRRHAAAFARLGDDALARSRILHAMRGAAAMMGLSELAGRLAELETETRAGNADAAVRALPQIDADLRAAGFEIAELSLGVPRIPSSLPPARLDRISSPGGGPRASDRPSLDPEVLAYFFSEARTRVERLGEVVLQLARPGSLDALDEAFRHVHAVKGAASTVGLGSIARGAHALEAALLTLKARGRELSVDEIEVIGRARGHLSVSLASPASAPAETDVLVALLRDSNLIREHDLQPVAHLPRDRARESPTVDVIRVPVHTIAGLTESVTEVDSVGDRLTSHAAAVREFARWTLRSARSVHDALQRIGPPRPWGAPADAIDKLASLARALAHEAGEIDREGERLGHDGEVLSTLAGGARDALQRLGASSAGWVFERLVTVAETLARRESKDVMVVRVGDDVEIARGLAERLVEPLAQLVRNAVTHGVEPGPTRMTRGKPARASLRLEASVTAGRLRIAIEDDGAGVDIAAAGERAIALGLLTEAQARSASTVLATLFMPGVSTRVAVDTAAGRGFGLDLVYREITQMGGEISVASQRGRHTRFAIEIAMRPLAQRMLVVTVGGGRAAMLLERVVKVVGSSAEIPGVAMVDARAAIGVPIPAESGRRDVVVLVRTAAGPMGVRVDGVERAREFVVRPMPALIAGLKPWSAATIDGEGCVIPVIDLDALSS